MIYIYEHGYMNMVYCGWAEIRLFIAFTELVIK